MSTHQSLCVIIPVHKPIPSMEEQASLKACYEKLKNYDCFLIYPEGLNTEEFLKIHPKLVLKPVSGSWLSSILAYNRMKMNPAFYRMFDQYDFMMTYELDSYIFSHDIEMHNGFAFDFIGAPVYEGFMNPSQGAKFTKALNGGFSIRNMKACTRVLELLIKFRSKWKQQRFFFSNFPIMQRFKNPGSVEIIYDDHLTGYFRDEYFNEDMIWTVVVPKLFSFFSVAPCEDALKFSFEVNPSALYEMNHQKLPLGCHAWQKFYSFWKAHIPLTV